MISNRNFTRGSRMAIEASNFNSWAWESHQLAERTVYGRCP